LRYGLFIKPNYECLAALLEQTRKLLRCQLSLRTPLSPKISAWALVNIEAPRHVHFDNRARGSRFIWKLHADNSHIQWGLDDVVADFMNECLDNIQFVKWNALDSVRLVFNPKHTDSVIGIGHSCKLISQIIALRTVDFVSPEADGLEFKN
jgi:hypothetical protein